MMEDLVKGPENSQEAPEEKGVQKPSRQAIGKTEFFELIKRCLHELITALKSMGLYPGEHPIVASHVERAFETLQNLLEILRKISFTAIEDTLFVNRQEFKPKIEPASNFILRLRQHRIRTVSFSRGMTLTEFKRWVEIMAMDPKVLRQKGHIKDLLSEARVSNISVEELILEPRAGTGEGKGAPAATVMVEGVDLKDRRQVEQVLAGYLMGTVEELPEEAYNYLQDLIEVPEQLARFIVEKSGALGMGSLSPAAADQATSEAARMLQSIGATFLNRSPGKWGEVKQNLTEGFLELDPLLRSRLLRKKGIKAFQDTSILDELVADLSDEQIAEIIVEEASQPGSTSEELTEVFDKLVPERDQFRNLEPVLEKKMREGDVTEEIVSRMLEPTIIELFTGPEAPDPEIENLVKNLGIEQYREKIKENGEGLKDLLGSLTDEQVLERWVITSLEMLGVETDLEAYSRIIGDLERAVPELLESGLFDLTLEVVDTLREHAYIEGERPPSHCSCAREALERLKSEEAIKLIVSTLQRLPEAHLEQVMQILLRMEEKAVVPLVELLSEVGRTEFWEIVVEFIKDLGEAALPPLERLLEDERWEVVRRTVRLIGELGDETYLKFLKAALEYPHRLVREEVINSLRKNPGPLSIDLLLMALNDPEPSVCQTAISALGEIGGESAVPTLIQLTQPKGLFDKELELRKEAILALGKTGSHRAISHLIEILRHRSLFATAASDDLRATAAIALGRVGGEEAKKALAEGAKDKRRAVREACQSALRRLGV